jgi:hypothetical protein
LQDAKADSMNRLMKDLAVDRAQNPDAALLDQWEAEEDEDQEGEDIDIVDRSKPFCEDLDVGCLAHYDDWLLKVVTNGLGSISMSPELGDTVRKISIGQGLVDIW